MTPSSHRASKHARPRVRSCSNISRLRRAFLVPAILLGLAACEEPAPEAPDTVPSVKTITVGERAAVQQRQIAGTIEAVQLAQLSFAVPGTVQEVLADEGMSVTAGQVLGRLDPRSYELALAAAQANLASARAELEERQLNFSRQQALFAKDIVAKATLDQAMAALNAARARVAAVESEVARARRDIERTALVAPYDGSIAARLVEPFQEVASGAVVFELQGGAGLNVDVLLPETLIRQIAYGDAATVGFPTLPGVEMGGTIAEIGSRVEAGNAFPVTIRLETEAALVPAGLRPGMTARVTFDLAPDERVRGYLIPLSAIAFGQGAAGSDAMEDVAFQRSAPDPTAGLTPAPLFVYDEAAGIVRKVTVLAGDLRGNSVEVYEGIEPGDHVVVAGVAFLRDGMRVRLWTPDL